MGAAKTLIMEQEGNEAARDLWSQMYERAAAHPGAAVMDPDYDPREDEARARSAFAAAGWSEDALDAMLEAGKERNATAPQTSPGVNPSAEAFHASLCDDVEAEMARQGFETQRNVARGIEPVTGPFASKAGVIMTEQSIITAGAFTFRFCGLIAKAFHRTIMLRPFYWQSDEFTVEGAKLLLRINMPLALYWNRIFMSFAISGTNATVPFEPSRWPGRWSCSSSRTSTGITITGTVATSRRTPGLRSARLTSSRCGSAGRSASATGRRFGTRIWRRVRVA